MLAPFFLAGLVAIGLPWWLHRLARSETTPQVFPSLMLLERSELRDTRRRQLRYLFLLALRIALIVALAFAFARPQWYSSLSSALTGKASVQLIVLDTSLSMRMGSRWQQAKEQAIDLIDSAKDSDRLLLVAAAGRKVQLLAGPVVGAERGNVRAALETLAPSMDRLDFGLAMSSAKAWQLDGDAGQLPVELHFISDMQQTGSPLRFADLEPPVGARLHLHTIAHATADKADTKGNAAIARVDLSGGEQRTLAVKLALSGQVTPPAAILRIDDREVGRLKASAVDGNSASINFTGLKLAPGTHRLHVQLEASDALVEDNQYYAVIEHADPRVLLIARDPRGDEATYLAAAIEAASAPRLSVVRSMPEQVTTHRLSDYAAIVVADSGVLTEATAQRLTQHAQAGGKLFVTLGPQALRTGRDPIGNFALRALLADKTGDVARIGSVDDSHPALREPEAWRGVRFFRRLSISPRESERPNDRPGDRVLLRFEDGVPLLIERKLGAGDILTMAAPLNREWNDLAVHPVFVRFIAETARYLAGSDTAAVSALVGATVATGIAEGAGGQIFDPSGERVLALAEHDSATRLTPRRSGFYEVRSANGARFIAANVDPRESSLTPMSADTLSRWQALERPVAESTPATNADSGFKRDLGRVLLMLAALLMLAELLLANYRLRVVRDA